MVILKSVWQFQHLSHLILIQLVVFFLCIGLFFLVYPKIFFYCIPDICCRKTVETKVSSITPRKEHAFTIRPINLGGWVNLLRNPAGFWLCFCYHFLENSRDFRFLYQWAAVIFCLMWELECVGVVSVFLFPTQFSAVPVWSISPTFWYSSVIDCCLLFEAYEGNWEVSHFSWSGLGLDNGCAPEFQG